MYDIQYLAKDIITPHRKVGFFFNSTKPQTNKFGDYANTIFTTLYIKLKYILGWPSTLAKPYTENLKRKPIVLIQWSLAHRIQQNSSAILRTDSKRLTVHLKSLRKVTYNRQSKQFLKFLLGWCSRTMLWIACCCYWWCRGGVVYPRPLFYSSAYWAPMWSRRRRHHWGVFALWKNALCACGMHVKDFPIWYSNIHLWASNLYVRKIISAICTSAFSPKSFIDIVRYTYSCNARVSIGLWVFITFEIYI